MRTNPRQPFEASSPGETGSTFNQVESVMKGKLLNLTKIAASVALAVAAGVFLAILILPLPHPPQEGQAAFKAWEAQQARQEGRGGAQIGKDGAQ
jgi:hypothetical protein